MNKNIITNFHLKAVIHRATKDSIILHRCFILMRLTGDMICCFQQEKFANYCQYCRKEFGLIRKKHNCKVCGLALCKTCAYNELLIYIPDDGNKNIQEPEIVIIKIVGVG